MPVAESELVAGYMVEYTGFRFLFFFIGEFGTAFAFAALAATLFLGGYALPWVHGDWANVIGPFVLFAKLMLVAFLMFWARFTYPRLREDQLQSLAWKVLIPLGLLNLLPHRRVQGLVHLMARKKLPGMIGGLGITLKTMLKPAVTVQYPHEKEDPVPARAWRHRTEGRELHGLHAVRAVLPRLVHLHRGSQGEAPAAARGRSRAHGERARPLRHRLRALHVLRDLRRGVPVRRPVLEPEYEYSESNIAQLLHDKVKLGEWMATVPEPEPLEIGAEQGKKK
jgi:hypothetical protein